MKKRLVQINVVCNGSTGKIMCDISKEAQKQGYETYCFFGRGNAKKDIKCIRIGTNIASNLHGFIARFGFNGHGSYFATKRLIKKLKDINPDIIHLHNIHGYYINLKVLFNYLKNDYHGKIVWTLHDCWTFTGNCSYFTLSNCYKWKDGCQKCTQLKCYPKEYFDTTKKEYCMKKKLFMGLNNLVIVTPSKWLKNLAKQSFLSQYDIKVVNNGIDTDIFNSTPDEEIFEKYHIPKNRKVILGIANIWELRKGLNDFIELSELIDKEKYVIVLIGVDKKARMTIPNDIVCIERTDNQNDLAKIYSSSYVLFNPTYEDNYPTVNIESIACKTPVIAYDTGGCREQVENFNGGYIVDKKDYDAILKILGDIKKIRNIDDKLKLSYMVSNYIKIYKE